MAVSALLALCLEDTDPRRGDRRSRGESAGDNSIIVDDAARLTNKTKLYCEFFHPLACLQLAHQVS